MKTSGQKPTLPTELTYLQVQNALHAGTQPIVEILEQLNVFEWQEADWTGPTPDARNIGELWSFAEAIENQASLLLELAARLHTALASMDLLRHQRAAHSIGPTGNGTHPELDDDEPEPVA